LTGAATFPFKQLLSYPHEAEWTPFQTHYFSENLVAPGIVRITEELLEWKNSGSGLES
jgi:hypothetical protein